MEQEWIRDRRPTAADGDRDGDVRMLRGPSHRGYALIHWSYVGAGVPWQHTGLWQPPAEPVPTEADRIASRRVVQMVMAPSASNAFFVALCNDGSMWQLGEGSWIQLPAIPQP
jgi:hypothetical protein